MKTVTLEVRSLDETLSDMVVAMRSGVPAEARIAFDSPALLFRLFTARRWELLQAMTGIGAMSIRGVARLVGRDVKAVHRDVHALLDAGILSRDDDGRVCFPFDAVHVDFTLRAA